MDKIIISLESKDGERTVKLGSVRAIILEDHREFQTLLKLLPYVLFFNFLRFAVSYLLQEKRVPFFWRTL